MSSWREARGDSSTALAAAAKDSRRFRASSSSASSRAGSQEEREAAEGSDPAAPAAAAALLASGDVGPAGGGACCLETRFWTRQRGRLREGAAAGRLPYPQLSSMRIGGRGCAEVAALAAGQVGPLPRARAPLQRLIRDGSCISWVGHRQGGSWASQARLLPLIPAAALGCFAVAHDGACDGATFAPPTFFVVYILAKRL